MTLLLESTPVPQRRRPPRRRWRGPQYEGEFPTLGWAVLEHASAFLPSPSDETKPLVFTDEQARLMLRWHQIDPETGRKVYRRGQLETAKGWGKSPWAAVDAIEELCGPVCFDGWDADGNPVGVPWGTAGRPAPWVQIAAVTEDQPLALDTVVPTPTGWTTIGELRPGDEVFAETGQIVRVMRETEIFEGLDCYAVTFSDGDRIVASGTHGWTLDRLRAHADHHERVTVTTAELAADYRSPRGGKRYRVAATAMDLSPFADLEIDPYLLGLWLGDWATADSTIATDSRLHEEMASIIEPLLGSSERAIWSRYVGNQGTVRIRNLTRAEPTPSFRERLRSIGVLGRKHIPAAYLRAGNGQRQSLLQGLIDSDGHVNPKGRVSFTNINGALVDDVGELLTTLGYVWSKRHDGTAWRLFFTPCDERPVARLAYKRKAQRSTGRRITGGWRYVESVERVESVPVRCIGIDTPDHLFLVGRKAIPTHNTENTYGVAYAMLVADDHRAAQELGIDLGLTRLHLIGRPGTLEPITTSAPSAEGARITYSVLDETHLWYPRNHGVALAGVLRRNTAKMGGRTLETTNAPVLGMKSVAETSGVDHDAGAVGVFRYAPRPEVEPDPSWEDDRLREALAKANPGAYWVDLTRRIEEIHDPATPWDEALRFWFNIRTTGAGRAIDPRRWDDLTCGTGKPRFDGQPPLEARDVPAGTIIGVGFDGSISRDATVIRGCTQHGYRFLIRAWVRPKGDALTRWLNEHPGERDWSVNRVEVNDEIARTFATWQVGLMLADPPKWWDEIEVWRRKYHPVGKDAKEIVVDFDTNQPTRMAPAVDRWRTAIREGSTTHDDDPITAEHVKHVQLRKVHLHQDAEDGRTRYVLMKGEDGYEMDAAVADVLAYEAAMTMDPPPAPVDRRLHVWR